MRIVDSKGKALFTLKGLINGYWNLEYAFTSDELKRISNKGSFRKWKKAIRMVVKGKTLRKNIEGSRVINIV